MKNSFGDFDQVEKYYFCDKIVLFLTDVKENVQPSFHLSTY